MRGQFGDPPHEKSVMRITLFSDRFWWLAGVWEYHSSSSSLDVLSSVR